MLTNVVVHPLSARFVVAVSVVFAQTYMLYDSLGVMLFRHYYLGSGMSVSVRFIHFRVQCCVFVSAGCLAEMFVY